MEYDDQLVAAKSLVESVSTLLELEIEVEGYVGKK